MTLSQLSSIISICHESLGFIVYEDDVVLWSMMRHTTPRRLIRAIELVAEDASYSTTTDRYNRLLELLRAPKVLAHR